MKKFFIILLTILSFASFGQTPPRTGYLVQPAKWKMVNPIWLDSGAYITKIAKAAGQNRVLCYDSTYGTIRYKFITSNAGTVTSVAALTLGTTGTDLSSTVANGTTTPVITLNVPTASASNRGALSSTDWSTFNNKGSGTVTSVANGNGLVGGTITGSGTIYVDTTKIASLHGNTWANGMFTGSTNNRSIKWRTNNLQRMVLDSNGNVGIGTTAPSELLQLLNAGDAQKVVNMAFGAYGVLGQTDATVLDKGIVLGNNVKGGVGGYKYLHTTELYGYRAVTLDKDGISIIANSGATTAGAAIASAERIRILNNGNVGIGTTSPNAPLQVQTGTLNTGVIIRNTNTTNGNSTPLFLADYGNSTLTNINIENYLGKFVVRTGATTEAGFGTSRLVLDTDGNVGLGGSITASTLAGANMVIQSTGNVGIGTTAPVSKLHIGVAPTASANYGLVSLGSGNFAGSGVQPFAGAAGGQVLAINTAANTAANFADFQHKGIKKFAVDSTGTQTFEYTNTATATTGNQTINKPSGQVNIAAAGTTVTVTNNLVTANSIVHAVIMTNDATATLRNVVVSAGSFVINIVGCTAETRIGFFVINR